jgi:hypothetical protein
VTLLLLQDLIAALKLIGLVDVEEKTFKKNALARWTKQLLDACHAPRDSSLSFQSLLQKRLAVQEYIHRIHLREQERKNRSQQVFFFLFFSFSFPILHFPTHSQTRRRLLPPRMLGWQPIRMFQSSSDSVF